MENLDYRVNEIIKKPGYISYPEKKEFIRNRDIYVDPSYTSFYEIPNGSFHIIDMETGRSIYLNGNGRFQRMNFDVECFKLIKEKSQWLKLTNLMFFNPLEPNGGEYQLFTTFELSSKEEMEESFYNVVVLSNRYQTDQAYQREVKIAILEQKLFENEEIIKELIVDF